jgi:hypothetical protein
MQLLRGGAAPGVLMPTVEDIKLLLEAKGVAGLKILLEPSSFKQIPSDVSLLLLLCGCLYMGGGCKHRWGIEGV